MKIWLNGEILDAASARIDPNDRGFTLADGLFETMRAQAGAVRRLPAHLARLRTGADALGVPVVLSDVDLSAALSAVLQVNDLANATLRLTVTRGPASRGLATPNPMSPTVMITAAPAAQAEPPPVRAIICSVTRRNEFSPLSRFKTLCYLDNVLARREAEQRGFDDALLLNTQGRLVESTIANLFLVIDGDVLTPPISDGALPGVARAEVIDRLGAAVVSLTPDDLAEASEAFLTNATGIRALIAVDEAAIGTGEEGPMTSRIKKAMA